MSTRKAVVERYINGFRRTDHAQILSCLSDDIVWNFFAEVFTFKGDLVRQLDTYHVWLQQPEGR